MTITSGASSASSAPGPSGSAIPTSASASSRRPRTVIRPGSPGPPPTSATPAARRRKWRGGGGPPPQPRARARGGGAPRGGGGRVGAPRPPAPVLLRLARDRRVDRRRARAGDDQPGAVAVAGPVLAGVPVDPALGGELFQRRGDGRRDQHHVGPR